VPIRAIVTRVSGEEQAALASEIRGLVEAELGQAAKNGVLRVEGDELVLRRGSSETRAELRGTLVQWEHLPDDLRARRVRQIAGLLIAEAPAGIAPPRVHRAPTPGAAPPKAGSSWLAVFAPLAILALTLGAIVVAYHFLAPAGGLTGFPSASASASGIPAAARVSADPDHERFVLASSACDRTRARVAQGASIGPADSEGWVVELVLLRRGAAVDLTNAPELASFITRKGSAHTGTVNWPSAKQLSGLQRFDAEVTLSALPSLGAAKTSGLDLVFAGPYALPYFTEDQRDEYFRFAEALADALRANAGALFARCAQGQTHQIGSWFLGATPGEALGSLIYFMASYSDTPQLKPTVLGVLAGPPKRDHAFDAINEATAKMDRDATATLLGRELGMVSGGKDRPTRLTFPFRDANRATRASLLAARALSLANSG